MHNEGRKKVLGVGLPRTATTSIADALNSLGFRCLHSNHIENPTVSMDVHNPKYKNFEAFVDTPFYMMYKQFEAAFPGRIIYIWTHRELEPWLASFKRLFQVDFKRWSENTLKHFDILFGSRTFDESLWREVYFRHAESVEGFLKDKRFLKFDIAKNSGEKNWSELCQLLNVPVPDQPFPSIDHLKSRDDFASCMSGLVAASKQSEEKVSFCIPCKDRIDYLKQTLPVNLRHNRRDRDNVEFILVDFASEDGLRDWVLENFQQEMKTGYLKFFYTENMPTFHMSLAKNTAHLFASGRILTSLDADNFTGPRGGRYVYRIFKKNKFNILLHQFSGTWRDGTSGRTSYLRDHFLGVGGYDETLEAFGYDELDLIKRIGLKFSVEKVSGVSNRVQRYLFQRFFKTHSHPRYNRAIKSPPTQSSESWKEMEKRNHERSDKNIAEKKYFANHGTFGITKGITRFVDGQFVECTPTCFNRDDAIA